MAAIGALLAMGLFPDTAAGRALHRFLVELPVRRLTLIKRHELIFAIGVIVMVLCASEIIALAGSFDLAILYAWDVSLYIDSVVAVSTLATTARIKPLARAAWARISARPQGNEKRPTPRRKRSSAAAPRSASNDTDAEPASVAA